jgi:hypothetical protein
VSTAIPRAVTSGDRLLALLPDGAQHVVEVDLARLRANPVVGPLVVKVLVSGDLPLIAGFADAESVVFAAYGLGTSNAATLTLFTAKEALAGATPIRDNIYAVGATDWLAQVQSRAAIEATSGLQPAKELLALRERAMPEGAPGASLRVSARLSFDARIALARITGIENAPGQLSLWADVVDDFAVIIDADATDPGDKAGDARGRASAANQSIRRMTATMQGALATLAGEPAVVALGLPSSLHGARLATRGAWVRAIIAIGPRHLQRVVERATAFLSSDNKAGT